MNKKEPDKKEQPKFVAKAEKKPEGPTAEERVRAYHNLIQLDAAPSITLSHEEQILLAQYSKENTAEQARQAEIAKNRKVLGLP